MSTDGTKVSYPMFEAAVHLLAKELPNATAEGIYHELAANGHAYRRKDVDFVLRRGVEAGRMRMENGRKRPVYIPLD